MHQKKTFEINVKFLQVLCRFNKNHIMRHELIDAAMKLMGLDEERTSGLIDRAIYQLKIQNLVHA